MRYALALLLSLLALPQEALPEKHPPQERPPKPRLDFYGDPLPVGAVARCGTVRFRTTSKTYPHLAFSPDGKALASSGEVEGAILVRDAATGEVKWTLKGSGEDLVRFAFSRDGKRMAALELRGGPIHQWDLVTGEHGEIRVAAGSGGYGDSLSPDLDRVAIGGSTEGGEHVIFLESLLPDKERIVLRGHGGPIESIVFSRNGKRIASDSHDGTIRIWDAATGAERTRIDVPVPDQEEDAEVLNPSSPVRYLVISPDGGTVAALAPPGIRIWDADSGEEISAASPREIESGYSFQMVAISPDGGSALTYTGACYAPCRLIRWEIPSGKTIFDQEYDIRGVPCFSPDGKVIAVEDERMIRFLDAATGEKLPGLDAHESGVASVAVTPDGRRVVSGSWDGTIRIWERTTGRPLRALTHGDWLSEARSLSPSGRHLVTVGGATRLWDLEHGATLAEVRGVPLSDRRWTPYEPAKRQESDPERISAHSFSPDGRLWVYGTDRGILHFVEVAGGEQVREIPSQEGPILCTTFSPDGGRVLSFGGGGTVRTFDVSSGDRVTASRIEAEPPLAAAAFSPDTESLVCGDARGRLRLCETEGGRLLREWQAHASRLTFLRFSPDGSRILSRGSLDRVSPTEIEEALRTGADPIALFGDPYLRVWDPWSELPLFSTIEAPWAPDWRESRDVVETIWKMSVGYYGESAAASPDGRYLALAESSDRIRIVELISGMEVRRLEGHTAEVEDFAFSTGGNLLASASRDTTVLLWRWMPSGAATTKDEEGSEPEPLERLWTDLAGRDAVRAHVVMRRMAMRANEAVPFLEDRLVPGAAVTDERIATLMSDLDDERFSVREEASTGLRRIGRQAEPALRAALEGDVTPEARHRIEALLRGIERPFEEFPSDLVRALRGIQVLEWIGTAEARRVLARLATGSPRAYRTRDARAALRRLESRPKEE